MIVLGADTHKRSHTVAAINAATGQLLGDNTVAVGARGFAALVIWARGLDGELVWALEDCRHVSGALERFLIARGERVVRVWTRLMAGTRRSSRERRKSDQIDAVSVARAALAAGIQTLPTAALAGPELDIRLLVDHRERLVRTRVALNSTLQWNLHDLWPELTLPGGALFSKKWTSKIARRLARTEQTMRVRIARDELRRPRELTVAVDALETEIADLVAQVAPHPCSPSPVSAPDRGQAHRRDRRRSSLQQRGQARPHRRRGADPGQLRQDQPPSPGSRREPPDQRRAASRRRHPRAKPPRDTDLPRPQTPRRQEHPRGHSLPQAPPRPPHLAPAPAAHPVTDFSQSLDIGAAETAVPAGRWATAPSRRESSSAALPGAPERGSTESDRRSPRSRRSV